MQKIIRLQFPELTKSIDTLAGYLKVLYHTDRVNLVSLKKMGHLTFLYSKSSISACKSIIIVL